MAMNNPGPSLEVSGCCCRASHFTQREVEVLSLVARGMVTADIATRLYISKRTVEAHLAEMLRRSGTHTRAELVALCYAAGIFVQAVWPPQPSGSYCLNLDGAGLSIIPNQPGR
jgi:DNA-binding NarL/FixJ family response regulator